MRIVTCITRLIRGGAQRVALETAARLTALGHDAPLWCGPETGAEGSLHDEAAARGVRVRVFPRLVRAIRPLQDLLAVEDLARALREDPPDWLHTHSSKAGIVGREAGSRAGLPRLAHTVHGWGFTPETPSLLRGLFVRLERRAGRRSRLVFVNPADRDEGRRLGIPGAEAGRVIPPGIDLAPFEDVPARTRRRDEIRARLGLERDAAVGGFLGRLAPQKDPETLLAVAASLAREFPALRWIVVGDGPLAARLKGAAASEPSLARVLRWTGLVEDPSSWLAALDFLLLPSRWEGTPLTVMEAMAAGLPVVASDLPGVRWLLAGAPDDAPPLPARSTAVRTGLLVPPGDRDGYVAAVRSLLLDPQARAALGNGARETAMAHFSLPLMLDRLLALYGDC